MADELLPVGNSGNSKRLKDMGDSSFAEVVSGIVAAGELHIGQVGGATVAVRVEKTRPADTAAYVANDAVNSSTSASTSWVFAVGRVATGSGVIVGAQLACDDTALVARFELDLYDADITTIQDNAEATRLYANQGKFIQTIAFGAAAKKTTNSTQAESAAVDVRIPFKCVGASSIYGALRILDADTPVSGAKYQVTLFAVQD